MSFEELLCVFCGLPFPRYFISVPYDLTKVYYMCRNETAHQQVVLSPPTPTTPPTATIVTIAYYHYYAYYRYIPNSLLIPF